MEHGFTGAAACCCKQEDCHVIENTDGYKNFYKVFKEKGVVWQPIKEKKQVWNADIEDYEEKEFLTDCKATVDKACTIELIDKSTQYKEDNIGIRFISFPSIPSFEDEKDAKLNIRHTIIFGKFKFSFYEEYYNIYNEEDDSLTFQRDNYITLDDKLIYEESKCFQEYPGTAFKEAAIIRKDGQAFLYAGSNLLEVTPGGKETIARYKVDVQLEKIDPVEIRYQDFQWWKPDKWWLFPERATPYYTPSEIKKLPKKKLVELKGINFFGKREKQNCRYPLRYPHMDIDPRLYCEDLAFKVYHLPTYKINSSPSFKINLNKACSAPHVLTWDESPALDIGRNPWDTVNNEEYHAAYHTQTFPAQRVDNCSSRVVEVPYLNESFNPPEEESYYYVREDVNGVTELKWYLDDDVIFAPNICIVIGQEESVVFEDIINVIKDPSVDFPLYKQQYFFNSITITKQPETGTATILQDGYSLRYTAAKDALGCVTIEYKLGTVFGLESKGAISIYIVDKSDPFYENKYQAEFFDELRDAYVLQFWTYEGDKSLQTYHDDIILNRVELHVYPSFTSNGISTVDQWAPCSNSSFDHSYLYQHITFSFNIRLSLYAGVRARVMTIKNLKKLKYIYVPGASYQACLNRLGELCKSRDNIINALSGSIDSIDDVWNDTYNLAYNEIAKKYNISAEDVEKLDLLGEAVYDHLASVLDDTSTLDYDYAWTIAKLVNKNDFVIYPLDDSFECWYGQTPRLSKNRAYNESNTTVGGYRQIEFDTNLLSKIYVRSFSLNNHITGRFKHDIQNPLERGSGSDLKTITITMDSSGGIATYNRNASETLCRLAGIEKSNSTSHTIVIDATPVYPSRNGTNVPILTLDLSEVNPILYATESDLGSVCPDSEKELWYSLEEPEELSNHLDGYMTIIISPGEISVELNFFNLTYGGYNLLKSPTVYQGTTQCNTIPGDDNADVEVGLSILEMTDYDIEHYDRV